MNVPVKSGGMPWLDALRAVEVEQLDILTGLREERVEHHPLVVAEVDPLDDPADEAVGAGVQERDAARPGPPRRALELVYLVAGLAAEQLGQLGLLAGTRWIAMLSAFIATPNVWFLSEMPATKRGGWMLHWVANPIRQPERSPPAATVAMNIG